MIKKELTNQSANLGENSTRELLFLGWHDGLGSQLNDCRVASLDSRDVCSTFFLQLHDNGVFQLGGGKSFVNPTDARFLLENDG